MKKLLFALSILVIASLSFMSCEKNNVTPKLTLTLIQDDSVLITPFTNLRANETVFQLAEGPHIYIESTQFSLGFPNENGNHVPFILKYKEPNGDIWEYSDYSYQHGIGTDHLQGKVEAKKNGKVTSGNFDFTMWDQKNTLKKIRLTGSYSFTKP